MQVVQAYEWGEEPGSAPLLIVGLLVPMQGRFTTMTEVPKMIWVRMQALAVAIPLKEIKAMGFESKNAFLREKVRLFARTA